MESARNCCGGFFNARTSLYDEVSLSVSVQNPAVRLYERLGFRSVAVDGASMTMARARVADVQRRRI